MRRPIALGLAVLVAMGAAAAVMAAVMRTSESTSVSRTERFLRDASTGSRCAPRVSPDTCVVKPRVEIPYTTPTSAETVDVTVTITFQYRTSRGDPAIAQLGIADGSTRTWLQPRRGSPLAPSVVERRTTLTWIKKDLPAAGKAYTFLFSFGMPPLPVGEEGSFFASAQKPTVVIESWTAGD